MLNEFGVSILPIVLKNAENQKNVVRKILQVDPQVCTNWPHSLHLLSANTLKCHLTLLLGTNYMNVINGQKRMLLAILERNITFLLEHLK